MRRVRLEKLCETKKAQTERSSRRIESERLARRTRGFRAGFFGFGFLRQNFSGSIEHVVQSSRVDVPESLPQNCSFRSFPRKRESRFKGPESAAFRTGSPLSRGRAE